MMVDLIIIVILLVTAFIGLKTGLFNMLSRLIMLLLSLSLTLMLLGPVTGLLSRISFLSSMGTWLTHPIIETMEDTSLSIEQTIEQFALPPLLKALLTTEIPDEPAKSDQVLNQLTAVLFRFALTAAVFILLFFFISFLVRKSAQLLTRLFGCLPVIGFLNQIGGFLVGAAFGLVLINILLFLAGLLAPYIPSVISMIEQSQLAHWLYMAPFFNKLMKAP